MQLLLRAPNKFRQNDSNYLFQAFLDECEQACRGVHDKEFEPTEASKISGPRPLSVMVLMMMFVDEMKLRRRSCLCQESSTSNLKLTKILWLATCPKWIADTDQYFDLQSLLRMHQLSPAAVPL